VALLCSLANGIEYSLRLPLFEDGALHRVSLARERPLERLRRARPDVLFSDPAGLHWLAAQAHAPKPRLILTSAQYFSPEQREQLARAQEAPVVNYYASSDAGPIAWECLLAPGRFHVLLPDVWLEAIGGELVLTRLRESVLPLLRYRTGDGGDVWDDDCRCGYRGRTIVGFTGRRECLFRTPGGRFVDAWQVVWLFKHYPLRGFRLTQRAEQGFLLELQRDGAEIDARDLAERLRRALQVLGFPDPRLELRAAAELASGGDKPEPFRSALA
jgi:phenylacetate-coenzyme A ligase PaaK-like adenylate-forming protein